MSEPRSDVASPLTKPYLQSNWPLWPALPVAPYARRKTLFRPLGRGVYAFDQLIGIYYVQLPIRMTVVALSTGGLLVYAPVAPTEECLQQMQVLINRHGPVKYIILPSVGETRSEATSKGGAVHAALSLRSSRPTSYC